MDYVTLMGTEQVQSAAHSMRVSAERIEAASRQIAETFERLNRTVEDFNYKFELYMKENVK